MQVIGRCVRSLCLLLCVIGIALPALGDSVPFWGAKTSVPIDTPMEQLKKGEFLWMGDAVTSGPVVMVVSITEQRAYVYRNGILIGATTITRILDKCKLLQRIRRWTTPPRPQIKMPRMLLADLLAAN